MKKWIISGNSRNFSIFTLKIWFPHPPTVLPFLLVNSSRKNKIRTNEPEIYFKKCISKEVEKRKNTVSTFAHTPALTHRQACINTPCC